ncbi:MAG TPA: esterase, partial [Burkholderiaceae bacterium]|nr:esterase [Burkholderiaceae bacterium]
MRSCQFALMVLAGAVLAGCGGNNNDSGTKIKYNSQVTFGDSLSDVGSYAVGTVAALKGGKFTINGDHTATNPELTGKNWTEHMAAQFGLPVPCAAQTGLDGDAGQGFSVPVVNHAGCYGYAMGGSRVTNPVGPNHKLTGSALGALTVPVVTQIVNHLAAAGGKFKGDEIVFVMAGGNDLLLQLGVLSAGATAAGAAAGATVFATSLITQLAAGATNPATAAQAIGFALNTEMARPGHTETTLVQAAVTAAAVQPGNAAVASPAVYGPMVAKAQADATAAGAAAGAAYINANSPSVVASMATTGAELVAQIKTQIVTKGANRVVVNNLPDVASTPAGLSKDAATKGLINAMVDAFNAELSTGLAGESKVLLVDVFAVSRDQSINPAAYGLTNVTEVACDLSPAKNSLGSSLACNGSNLKPGDV